MGVFSLFFLCLLFASGSSNAERPFLEAIQRDEIPNYPDNQMIPFSDSVFTNERDTIPVVTPDPIFDSPPSPPMTTQPIITPVIPPPVTLSPPAMPISRPPPMTPVTTTPTTPASSSGGSWCVASQMASETALQVALDYACGYGGADCTGIQPGSNCYNPNTLRDHASYAFNSYYQKNPAPTSCVFGGAAQLTTTDPSSGSCRFASSRGSTSITPPITPTPMMPSPTVPAPFIASPMTPMMPNTPTFDTPPGSSIYGSEPTGTPSSAVSVSFSRLFVFFTTALLGSILAVTY